MPQFSLSKWYFDAVTPEGLAIVAYRAQLRWGALNRGYSAVLEAAPDAASTERSAWTAGHDVESSPDPTLRRWRWCSRPLDFEGIWSARTPSFRARLLEIDAGSIDWCCHAPSSDAEILSRGERHRASGYVEQLEMSLPPWRLPFNSIRWGRWMDRERSLVWIRWDGPEPLTLVLSDGRPAENASVSDDAVGIPGVGELRLAAPRVVREGELGRTVLRVAPVLRRALPRATLGTTEHKWLSRGRFIASDGRVSEGWAMHELIHLGSD